MLDVKWDFLQINPIYKENKEQKDLGDGKTKIKTCNVPNCEEDITNFANCGYDNKETDSSGNKWNAKFRDWREEFTGIIYWTCYTINE